ncbi:MAG: hypothetical protein JWP20_396 [Roseomonas sp.]|jgi:tripartite-type tricarboxylate transporter receptor subunit TctC|nr:hypothetical protein [Roseomonas sp.]
MIRRRMLLAGAAATPVLARAVPTLSQIGYPSHTVSLVVPFPPGGANDILARVLSQRLGAVLGQPVVIDNRGGAGGSIGSEMVVRAAPDGHTLLWGHIGTMAVNPWLYPKLNYDTLRDLAPVALVALLPSVLVVHPSVPAKTLAEFVALAKAQPGVINYGSSGNGSATHISMAAVADAAQIELTHVPYRGTAPMATDLLGGRVQASCTGTPGVLGAIQSGQLRALAVTSLERVGVLPQVPTMAESGYPGFECVQWHGVVAPAATPPAVVMKLNHDINAILADPAMVEQLAGQGAVPAARTPDAFRDLIVAERQRWGVLVKRTGISAE